MAHQWMRCNLASAVFPFATELWGRSIILPQYDQNFDRTVNSPVDRDKDKGVPQAFYMHNCVPTIQGYQAIGFDDTLNGIVGATDFDAAFPLIEASIRKFLFVPAVGKNYVYDADVGHWASVSPIAPGTLRDDIVVTIADIQGQTYIYYANYGCIKYNSTTKLMDAVTLTGLVAANTKGICAANGYMIAWDDTTVAWTPVIPPDFTPSLITGAGGGSVGDAKGKIIACLPVSGGFIVYCEGNAVSAKFTSNARFPFIFNEVPGSGGISSPEQVSWQSNLGEHYAWTTVGLQKFSLSTSSLIYPEATDFLAALIYEDFDEATLTLTTTNLSTPLNIKLSVIEDRYAVLSYGVSYPDYTYALVFDISLGRWGKFKIDHRDCFQFNNPNLYGALTYGMLTMTYGDLGSTTYGDLLTSVDTVDLPKKTLAFLQKDGTVKVVNFDLSEAEANGVFIIGKFQFQRNRFVTHQSTDVENLKNGAAFQMYLLPSLDGKSFLTPVAGVVQNPGPLSRRYNKRVTGLNFSELYIGAFNLTSLMINFTQQGDR